ncbi:hypothetical protein [Pseudothermotoga sp.]|uniref:hypothetical protein n=1 Tax=Pseudothermotoga sp. TaxID=2033661 RepID=UPI0031F71CD2
MTNKTTKTIKTTKPTTEVTKPTTTTGTTEVTKPTTEVKVTKKDQILALLKEGKSVSEVAKMLGIRYQMVYNYKVKYLGK